MNNVDPSLFTCVKCANVPPPPWQSCRNSHMICPSCRKNTLSCPSCGNVYEDSPNNLILQTKLETLVRQVGLPLEAACPNKGCEARVALDMYLAHVNTCAHQVWKCPLAWFGGCTWTGREAQVIPHLVSTEHKDTVIVLPDTTGTFEALIPDGKKVSAVLPDAKAIIHFLRTCSPQRLRAEIHSLTPSPVSLAIFAQNEAHAFSLDAVITAESCLRSHETPGYRSFTEGYHVDVPVATRIQVRAQPAAEKRKAPVPAGEEAEADGPAAKVARVDADE